MKPKSGIYAKDPNSDTQKRLNKRTRDALTGPQLERRNRYIEGLLKGFTKKQAAMYAGAPPRSAAKEGSQLFREPYVQETFAKLREEMEEEQLLSRKELILNAKSIAFDDEEQGNTRVSASSLLAKLLGYEKAHMMGQGDEPAPMSFTFNVAAPVSDVKVTKGE